MDDSTKSNVASAVMELLSALQAVEPHSMPVREVRISADARGDTLTVSYAAASRVSTVELIAVLTPASEGE